jgi:hypothetical protein
MFLTLKFPYRNYIIKQYFRKIKKYSLENILKRIGAVSMTFSSITNSLSSNIFVQLEEKKQAFIKRVGKPSIYRGGHPRL